MTDVKILQLQKDIEGFRRKLQDATDDKKKAISRLNKEFEQKCLIERDRNLKKWEVDRQELYLTLETNIKLAKDKEVQQILTDKNRDLRKMRDNMNYERDNAIRIAKASSEEKYRTLFRQMQEESKSRDDYLTKEISLLSKEKESLQERISAIRKTDLEKANTIKGLHYTHEKVIKDLNEAAKKDSATEYKRYRSLEQYAHDKESEVNILNSKVLRLDNDKEILEKQVLTVSKFGEAHGSTFNPILAPRVLSNREVELARRVRELEKELQQRHHSPQQRESKLSIERVDSVEQTARHASLDITSPFSSRRANSSETTVSSQSPSVEFEEKLKRLQRQRHELRELVLARDQQIHQLEQRINDITHDHEKALRSKDDLENHYVVEKESFLMDHNKEMDELSMNNTELQEKLQECSSELIAVRTQLAENEQSRAIPAEASNIEQEAVLLQNQLSVLENNYKRVQRETLVTEALFSQWSAPEQHITMDSNDRVMQLELELSYTKNDLREVQEKLDGFQIRNEKLKLDYQKSRNDVDRLICQRERANDEKKKAEEIEKEMRDDFKELSEQISRYSNLDNELKNQREKYIKAKESLTSRIEHQQGEIERLRTFEMKALQVDALKRELEQYRMNGNGNAISPPVSPGTDEIIKRLNSQISSQREELNMQSQIIKAKSLLINQMESRGSPIAKLSAPTSTEQNPNIPKHHTKHSPPKACPTRRTTSTQLLSFDDSYNNSNNNSKFSQLQQPNIHGSLTLPRPVKLRPKLVTEKSDEL